MGASNSTTLSEEQLKEYQELTFLSKQQIEKVFKRYTEIIGSDLDDNVFKKGVPVETITQIEEFAVNPFRDRICKVFAFTEGVITFEDFLDMMSVFSDNAPLNVKAEYAFRIYDFDEDDMLSRHDLNEVVNRLCCGYNVDNSSNASDENTLTKEEMNDLLDRLFTEGDLDRDGHLSFSEFEHVISKAPDFANSFRIRL